MTTTAPKASAQGPALMVARAPNLHQCGQDGSHVDIQHRPAADQFDDPVELGPLHRLPGGTALNGDQQQGQGDQLEQRHHDAGGEHHQARSHDPECHR